MKFFSAVAGVALLSLAAIPVRGAVHSVTVGGPGILQYTPQFVVSFAIVHQDGLAAHDRLDCRPGRYSRFHVQAEKPHCYTIYTCEPMSTRAERF